MYSKSIKTDTAYYHNTCTGNSLACYVAKKYTGTQGLNEIYFHNGTIKSGTIVIDANDSSYRYAGANPNNYVCFGSDAATCSTDNLYRIIGVFGDQVKLIKYDYATSTALGTGGAYNSGMSYSVSGSSIYKGSLSEVRLYYWASSSNSSNVWSESALNTTNLNGTYLTHLGTTWTSKIATTTWKVGGNSFANIGKSPMYIAYQNEIVSPAESTTYNAKIGLMYVSDYGYAAGPTYWTYPGYSGSSRNTNDYRAAINANWMHMGVEEWTISRSYSRAFYVVTAGHVDSDSSEIPFNYYSYGVRPCFYLNSNVLYAGGEGTKTSPYKLS